MKNRMGPWMRRGLRLVAPGILVWILLGGEAAPVEAASALSQDFRLWSPVSLTVSLPSSFLAYMEVNPRFGEDVSELNQLLLRPAVGYTVTEHISIWQGYAWVGNFQPSLVEEHRAYQQLNYTRTFPSFKIFSRTRLEERVIEHVDGTAVRFRTMLRGVIPFPPAPEWAFAVYEEIFVNLNSVGHGPAAGFDQNRFFLGVNRTFTPQLNIDVGYQHQLLNSRHLSGFADHMNHIILVQVFINL